MKWRKKREIQRKTNRPKGLLWTSGIEQCCAEAVCIGSSLPKARCQDKKVVTAERPPQAQSGLQHRSEPGGWPPHQIRASSMTFLAAPAGSSSQEIISVLLSRLFREKQTIVYSNGEVRSHRSIFLMALQFWRCDRSRPLLWWCRQNNYAWNADFSVDDDRIAKKKHSQRDTWPRMVKYIYYKGSACPNTPVANQSFCVSAA